MYECSLTCGCRQGQRCDREKLPPYARRIKSPAIIASMLAYTASLPIRDPQTADRVYRGVFLANV